MQIKLVWTRCEWTFLVMGLIANNLGFMVQFLLKLFNFAFAGQKQPYSVCTWMGVVFQFKKRNQYIDTEVWISCLCWHVTKSSSFDFFPPIILKCYRHSELTCHTKIGTGLDLGGGLWYADICCGEMIECTLTTWVKNEGAASESLLRRVTGGHLVYRGACGICLEA